LLLFYSLQKWVGGFWPNELIGEPFSPLFLVQARQVIPGGTNLDGVLHYRLGG
jgi:hypothetical protein